MEDRTSFDSLSGEQKVSQTCQNPAAPCSAKTCEQQKGRFTSSCAWVGSAIKNHPVKFVALLILIGLIIFVIVDSLSTKLVVNGFSDFIDWLGQNGEVGVLVFACVYAVATICMLPGSVLTIGSGTAFTIAFGLGAGIGLGILAVFVGAFVGLNVAFVFGRFIFKSAVEGLSKKFKIIEAIDKAFEAEGLRINLLLRLSPVIPFNAFNYVMGATRVKWRDYCIGSLGILPGTAAYVYIGALIGEAARRGTEGSTEGSEREKTIQIVVAVVGGVATVVALILITRYARKSLQNALKEHGEDQETTAEPTAEKTGDDLSDFVEEPIPKMESP